MLVLDENLPAGQRLLPHKWRIRFRPDLAHDGYCLVWLDVRGLEAARFIRRFLRHPAFNTSAKRMGLVIRAHVDGVSCWRPDRRLPQDTPWPAP